MTAPPDLLERDSELAFIDRLIGDARGCTGRVAVTEGSAGVGKTALLAAARDGAAEGHMRVLAARGSELERELAFWVVRHLFEAVLARAPEAERAELLSGAARLAGPVLLLDSSPPTDPSAALHGLYLLSRGDRTDG